MLETITEFEAYLDRSGLLPRWRYLLDVVNCGQTMDEIKNGAYMCPNRGGPYTHARARFLGTYQLKAVRTIHEIAALVVCSPGGTEFTLNWRNSSESKEALIARAREMTTKINPSHVGN